MSGLEAREAILEYPFDPTLDVHRLDGIEKLRCIEDRRTAAELWELYWIAQRNANDPGLARRRLADEHEATEERLRWLTVQAKRCLDGGFGKKANEEARDILTDGYGHDRTDLASLEAAWKVIERTRER